MLLLDIKVLRRAPACEAVAWIILNLQYLADDDEALLQKHTELQRDD